MKDYARKLGGPTSRLIQERYARSSAQMREDLEFTKELLPVGTVVRVQLGKALVDLQIVRHGCSWSHPFEVSGVNLSTGKKRKFDAGYHLFSVIEAATAQGGK